MLFCFWNSKKECSSFSNFTLKPDFSGEDVIDAIVKEGIMDKQKIMIFTASTATQKEYGPLLEKGVHSIITKPVDIDILIETIKKMPSG